MNLPNVPATLSQERIGINIVAEALARSNLIWRETPVTDMGIDGQIEYVNKQGQATGQLVAAQVKTGPSYLIQGPNGHWAFYPAKKHREYWERFPVPVLLLLCDPSTRAIYWIDARQYLRTPSTAKRQAILIPQTQTLTPDVRDRLYEGTGLGGEGFLDVETLLTTLFDRRTGRENFDVSFFDLFAMGLTNVVHTLYFDAAVALTVAEARTKIINMTALDEDFMFEYTEFIAAQQISDVPFSECMIDWYDHRLVPSWMGRLTSRGQQLVQLVDDLERRYRASGVLVANDKLHAMQVTFVRMDWSSDHWNRIDLCGDLQRVHRDAVQQ